MTYNEDTEFIVWQSEEPPEPIPYSSSYLYAHAECPFWSGIGFSRMFWVSAVKRLVSTGQLITTANGYIDCPGSGWAFDQKKPDHQVAAAGDL